MTALDIALGIAFALLGLAYLLQSHQVRALKALLFACHDTIKAMSMLVPESAQDKYEELIEMIDEVEEAIL